MALGVGAAIGCGIAIGLVNGVLISRLSINPLIATLAMASIVRGVVLIASEGTIYRAQGDAAAHHDHSARSMARISDRGVFFHRLDHPRLVHPEENAVRPLHLRDRRQ